MNENRLEHLAAFGEHIPNMQLSETAQQTLAETPVVLLVGPTSSGRNTIIQELLSTGAYHNIISDTTRQKRTRNGVPVEEHGREYWFRDEGDVLADIIRGEFLEAAIIHGQQVSGISIRELKAAHEAGQIAITDVEPTGASTIHARKSNATLIFVVPPAFGEWMMRLQSRHDMPEAEIRRRLETACLEIQTALEAKEYIFVLNDQLAAAVEDIDTIVRHGKVDAARELFARKHAAELLKATKKYLAAIGEKESTT